MDSIPFIDPLLLSALDRLFPQRCPDPKDPEREIWMKAGERRVVEFLMAVSRSQQEDILNV